MHRESADAEHSVIIPTQYELQQLFKDYDPDCIYNMDETGLFYRMLPNSTLVMPYEHDVKGGKKEKCRVTLILCCNLSGSHKLPLCMIGKPAMPRIFKNNIIQVPYFNQSN